MSESRFNHGDRVRLIADPEAIGRVDGEPVPYLGGWTYPVFFGAKDTRFVQESGLDSVPDDARVAVLTRDEFLRSLLLAKLDNPLTDLLYAYQASRTQFEPYQFKPVIKYLDAPVPGILIADEVGLGKTIEAAILYQELKARTRVSRVLIVCPAGLRLKWQAELLTRFDESFTILNRRDLLDDFTLYHETDGLQPIQGITGLETIRGRGIQEAMDERPVRYDMVIIDEAHHLRTAGRLSNRIGERLSDLTDNLVLLTATPLQTSQQDLFNLLKFIDETQFQQFSDFELQLEPNANLNMAIRALRTDPADTLSAKRSLEAIPHLTAGTQVTAHPNYGPTVKALQAPAVDRRTAVRLQRDIDQMNVISAIYTRTRKRDVTGIAKREAHVIQISITDPERAFYDAVLAEARAVARRKSKNGWIPGFTGMMRERQAASCLAATRTYLLELHKNEAADLMIEDSSTDVAPDDQHDEDTSGPGHELADLIRAAQDMGTTDSKYTAFQDALGQALAESAKSKVIVFTYFRRTLAYLERHLREHGYQVISIHGGIPTERRAALIDDFKSQPNAQILLTSEVGAEGLDFQFCDTMFNYDLPWNPMRVEQRIGRIDRYGQKADKIRIYSFFLSGTIEERILERLYIRIGIFEESIGDLEPILGPLTSALTREIFTLSLTPAEEAEVATRYGDLILQRREEELALERRSAELLGQDALILQAVNDTVSSGRYVSPAEMRSAVGGFLEANSPVARLDDTIGDGTATLRTDERIARIVADHVTKDRDTRPMTTEFLTKLQRSAAIPVTFDGETAMLSRRLELLNLRHPLVRAAVEFWRGTPRSALPIVDLLVLDDSSSPRSGPLSFAIFLLRVHSAQIQTRLLPIVVNSEGHRVEAVENRLLAIIQEEAQDRPDAEWSLADRSAVVASTTGLAAQEADRIESDARDRNEAVLAVRQATLERTFRSKIKKRKDQIQRATNANIQRLWAGEIRNLEAELEKRLEELEARRKVGVSFTPIGGGRLTFATRQAQAIDTTPLPSPDGKTIIEGWPEPPIERGPWA